MKAIIALLLALVGTSAHAEVDYFLNFVDEPTAIVAIGSHVPPSPINTPLHSASGWRSDITIKCAVSGGSGFYLWVATTAQDAFLQPYSDFVADSQAILNGQPFVLGAASAAKLQETCIPGMAGRVYPFGPAMLLGEQGPTHTALYGVNLSGAEFGGQPFFAPVSDMGYYYSKGMTVVRVPFLWERVQPVLGGPLDPVHVAWLTGLIQASPRVTVLLDVHNYGRYNNNIIAGVGGPTNAQFANLWMQLAAIFGRYPNVAFGLMNEPHDQDLPTWLTSVNAAIAAIRSVGATNLVTVPGIAWTGAWTWISSGNAATMIGVVDPARNFVYEVHQYFDSDGSGSSATAVSSTIGSERIDAFTQWARQNRVRGLLGEFGAANNPTMLSALGDVASYMQKNSDVWAGWTYWSGGPFWGAYIYSIEPTNLGQAAQVDSAQMTTLAPYLQ